MANTASAKKRVRSNARKARYNRIVRVKSRTAVKAAREAVEGAELAPAQTAVARALSELDKAANKGVIHRNNAARRKSRLMKQLNSLAKAG